MSYKPNQTDLQIIVQNQSERAISLLTAVLEPGEELDVEEVGEAYAGILATLLDVTLGEIEGRVKKYKAEVKTYGSKTSSAKSGSRSSGSRSGGRSSSARSGSAKASAKQVKFALDLLEGREHDYDYVEDDLIEMSMTDMRALIDELKDAPELD